MKIQHDYTGQKVGMLVVPCCTTCNKAKLDLTTQEFFDWVARVYHTSKWRQA